MNRIKELRENASLSQLELAKKLNTSQRNIGRWENEENEISASNLVKLADIFECTIDYLVGREDDFGVISSSESSLNGEEERLLSLFRQLPNTRKKTILDTMSDMVSARKLSEDVS